MILTKQRLLETVSGRVRKLLVRERACAMAGSLDDALGTLAEAGRHTSRISERVSIGLLRAELLDGDLQFEEAEKVFKEEVEPYARELPDAHRFVVERNGIDFANRLWKGTQNYYHLVDRERSAGVEWLDYQDLFQANQKAAAGKHYEALPLLWQQLRRAYLSGCWFAQRIASSLFTIEGGALGEWDTATHHLLLSRDDDLVRMVADGVSACGQPKLTRRVIDRILTTANLKRHFIIGSRLLTALADSVPDADIPRMADWLFSRASGDRRDSFDPNVVSDAWKAIGAIGERLDAKRAEQWLAMAYAHSIWTTRSNDPTRVIPERDEVVGAVLPIAWVVRQSAEQVNRLGEQLLPLLADSNHASGYALVLNLLCHVADWGGDATRAKLADALYPAGKPVNYQLASAAKYFGKQGLFTPERLGQTTVRVAAQIRLQVQRLKPGETPVTLDEYLMQYCHASGELLVTVANFSGLANLVEHRHSLTDESLALLVRAALELSAERDNPCSNRTELLDLIRHMADRIGIELRREIVDAITPLADGPILESESGPKSAEASNPLNPFKFNMGSPDSVQAMAIVALAAFAYPDETLHLRLWPILTDRCYDGRASIRRGAYSAARLCSTLDAGTLAGVLAGLRDPDAAAAVSAFAAVTDHPEWKLEKSQWPALLAAARFAARSPNSKLRRHATLTLRSRNSTVPRAYRAELSSLLDTLANDPAYSVRCACRVT